MADEPTTVSELVVTAPRKRSRPGGTKLYRPQISVVLKKNIARTEAGAGAGASERFTGAKGEIDLTPYLGEGSSVTVSKSCRSPTGAFAINFPDIMEPSALDSIYGLVEPMDVIEIRMARDVSEVDAGVPKRMPIMMRGFVNRVQRQTGISRDGPQRTVSISGHDYGKILQIMQIVYLPNMVLGQELLSSFKLFLNYGVDAEANQPAGEFVQTVLDKVVNPFLAKMRTAAGRAVESPILDLTLESLVEEGVVSPFGAQDWPGGTIYDLLSHFGDVGPWNELYVEDRESGPYLVYRPTPFRTLGGDMIQTAAFTYTVDVLDSDLVFKSDARSDDSVANYFWVDAPRLALVDSALMKVAAQEGQMKPEPFLVDYKNSSPELYGIRLMQTATQQGARTDGQSEAKLEAANGVFIGMVNEKRRVLTENNKDNVVLEDGGLRLMGNERIRAGCYVRLTRGGEGDNFESEHYAHEVVHEFTPFTGAYFTTVSYDRGTGFVRRIDRGGSGPYLAELNLKGSYGE